MRFLTENVERTYIYQNAQKGYLEEDVEAQSKPKKQPLAIVEPLLLLLTREVNPGEVRFK